MYLAAAAAVHLALGAHLAREAVGREVEGAVLGEGWRRRRGGVSSGSSGGISRSSSRTCLVCGSVFSVQIARAASSHAFAA